MRTLNGMHQSNGPQWNIEQYLQAAPGCVTLLHFQMRDDPTIQQHADHENANWFVKLRDGWPAQGIPPAPDRLIHVRAYHPNWTSLDPKAWARHIVDHLSRIESGGRVYDLWNDPLVTVSPANEQNLHYECGEPDPGKQPLFRSADHYRRIAAWNAAWADEVNRLRPNRKATLCWPALAFGHEPPGAQPDGEYTLPEVRAAIARYEIMATHPYALLHTHGPATAPGGKDALFFMLRDFRPARHDNPADPGGVLAQIPDKPLLITETGTFTHSDVSRTAETIEAIRGLYRAAVASGRVLGITPFIWHSDGAHPGNTIWPNDGLRALFADMPPWRADVRVPSAAPGSAPAPTPPPIQEDDMLGQLLREEFGEAYDDLRATLPANPAGPGGPFRRRSLVTVDTIAVHHTAGSRTTSWADVARGHLARGFAGIGYHVGIQGGRVAYLGDVETARANVSGENHRVIGVVVAGHYVDRAPEPEDVQALRRVVAVLDRFLGREVVIQGHGQIQGQATACPGSRLLEILPSLRRPAVGAGELAELLLAAGERLQAVQLNPEAALQKAILRDGFVPTSAEFEAPHADSIYHAQRAERLTDGAVRVYFVPRGRWSEVGYVERAA